MSLDRGTKLGPYEILGPSGAGGIGEVHTARDTRLNGCVARRQALRSRSLSGWDGAPAQDPPDGTAELARRVAAELAAGGK
jgi:hypothetical protein